MTSSLGISIPGILYFRRVADFYYKIDEVFTYNVYANIDIGAGVFFYYISLTIEYDTGNVELSFSSVNSVTDLNYIPLFSFYNNMLNQIPGGRFTVPIVSIENPLYNIFTDNGKYIPKNSTFSLLLNNNGVDLNNIIIFIECSITRLEINISHLVPIEGSLLLKDVTFICESALDNITNKYTEINTIFYLHPNYGIINKLSVTKIGDLDEHENTINTKIVTIKVENPQEDKNDVVLITPVREISIIETHHTAETKKERRKRHLLEFIKTGIYIGNIVFIVGSVAAIVLTAGAAIGPILAGEVALEAAATTAGEVAVEISEGEVKELIDAGIERETADIALTGNKNPINVIDILEVQQDKAYHDIPYKDLNILEKQRYKAKVSKIYNALIKYGKRSKNDSSTGRNLIARRIKDYLYEANNDGKLTEDTLRTQYNFNGNSINRIKNYLSTGLHSSFSKINIQGTEKITYTGYSITITFCNEFVIEMQKVTDLKTNEDLIVMSTYNNMGSLFHHINIKFDGEVISHNTGSLDDTIIYEYFDDDNNIRKLTTNFTEIPANVGDTGNLLTEIDYPESGYSFEFTFTFLAFVGRTYNGIPGNVVLRKLKEFKYYPLRRNIQPQYYIRFYEKNNIQIANSNTRAVVIEPEFIGNFNNLGYEKIDNRP